MKNYLLSFVCLSIFIFSCGKKKESVADSNEIKKAIGKVSTDSIAPPIVIPVTKPAENISPVITSRPFSLHEDIGKEVITTITTESGLPLGNYYNLVQDNSGNLWMDNNLDLIKYDGHSFYSYQPPLKDYGFIKLAIDRQQNIWTLVDHGDYGTDSSFISVFIFNGKSFQIVPELNSKFLNFRLKNIEFFQGPDNLIWVVNHNLKEIWCYDGLKRIKTITAKDFSFKQIGHISFGQNNSILFTDVGDTSVTKYDGTHFKTFTKKDGLPEAYIRSTIPLSGDSFYIMTNKGSFLFKEGKTTHISNIGSGGVADKHGAIWSTVSDSLIKLTSSGVVNFGKEDGFNTARLNSPFFDQQDNIWVASNNIVNRLYRPITSYYDIVPLSATDKRIRSFLQDRAGNYWFGSFQTGIGRYDGKSMINYSFLDKPATGYSTENNILSVVQDKYDNIWMNSVPGSLIKFDGKQFIQYKNLGTKTFPVKPVALFADSKGNIWFPNKSWNIADGKGVGYFNGKELVCFTTAQGLSFNFVSSIFEDSKGMIWIGTGKGLNRYDGKKFTVFTTDDGLPHNFINDITEDAYGRLWLCTSDGLSSFDGEMFTNYSIEQSQRINVIRSISKSTDKKLFWLSSKTGLTAMQLHTADSISFINLGKLDGFPIESSFEILTDEDGIVWFNGDNNNLKRVDHKKIEANAKPFALHITNVRINNKDLCWNQFLPGKKQDSSYLIAEMQHRFGKALKTEELEKMQQQFGKLRFDSIIPYDFVPYDLVLPISANAVSFDFAVIDPHFSKYTSYQYMLEGLDKIWSPLSKNTTANFGNLREGKYTFRVKALNSYGIWSETSYSFKVLPPWWRTWWAYAIYVLLFITGIYTFIRWRTNALKKEKIMLEEKVTSRTAELKESLDHLKATQGQLIQSEKMASLGELTAGIAHEIQNPLNFVNNFSEVSNELVDEMNVELTKGDIDEAKNIGGDIKQNLEKILHHGKRADAIVKGMLQHSRSSSGVKEPTDINALADEYLRLAYHGLRAKDKSFNATMKTDFDESLEKVNVIPQDIGRVILNLITNAFYAVNEKKKSVMNDYEPTVTVATKLVIPPSGGPRGVEIKVADNGGGIPKAALDKIFQPFFTTKPTGQGTGLGLSLSYDIVKAHGGELKVETKENEGTEFILQLPVT